MREKYGRFIGPAIGLVLLTVALWVLHSALRDYHYRDVVRHMAEIPVQWLLLALVLTIGNYFVLTGYDFLALKYIKRPIEYPKVALTSFISYAFSQNLGFGILTGGSLRYRLYSAWGLSASEITNVVAFCALTFWLGIFMIGGIVFSLEPLAIPTVLELPIHSVRPIGILFLLLSLGYLAWCFSGARQIRIGQWEFATPSRGLSIAQVLTASVDWALAGAVLYTLLPEAAPIGYFGLLGIFLLAQVVGLISHVPGGLGVFEAMVMYSLTPQLPAAQVLGCLVAFRVIYYLFPLAAAIVTLGTYEVVKTKRGLEYLSKIFGEWVPSVMPNVLALVTFIAGVLLLFSGATPAVHSRMLWMRDFLPLSVVEFSHILGSLVGAALLFLAWGVQKRVDAAYHLTVGLLVVGIMASLFKGLDYEEAMILTGMLVAFIPSRASFYRRSSLFKERFSAGWLAAIGVAIAASIWLGFFSYRHVEYSNDLWWQFAFRGGDAPRFLRASVGVVSLALIVAVARLLRPAPPDPKSPTEEEWELVRKLAAAAPNTSASLALLGDKTFLFNDDKTAFIMYGIEGRSWIAMGDPVGPVEEWQELVWTFREMSSQHGGWCVFYQVRPSSVHLYLDIGSTMQKLGEEARVDLRSFSLEGLKKTTRHSYRKIEKEGGQFEVIPQAEVAGFISELKVISDQWLEEKNTREKGFSLGSFDPEYLSQFPMGVVRQDGKLVAFANILGSGGKEELSIDLMRYLQDAPSGTMDFLFISLMLYGREQGYHWFNLGMAPFSGLENRPVSPIWSRVGALLYRHGEQFYNFQGLRTYKEKFNPVWEPRYLASPGGLALPRVLTNVASLVSGGLKGVVKK
jgi:phosphatidylglycerol lysyltransferase